MDLQLPVRGFMTLDVEAVPWNAPPSQVRRILRDRPFHHLPVVDGDRVVGIVSTVDLARVGFERWGPDPATVDAQLDRSFDLLELMTPDPVTVAPTDPLRRAAEALADGAFHALPVVEGGRLVGMITSTDILRALLGG